MENDTLFQFLANNPMVMGNAFALLFVLGCLIRAFPAILIGLMPATDKKTRKFFFVAIMSMLVVTFAAVVIRLLR